MVKRTKKKLPPQEWLSFIPNAHAGYITWEQFQENQKRLEQNTNQYRCQRQRTPPREGPALIQGIVLCGKCGSRMRVQYHQRRGQLYPDYICNLVASRYGQKHCQQISGRGIDRAISELLLQTVKPFNLEVALAVQHEMERRLEDGGRLRRQTVHPAQPEGAIAQRRYMEVDPERRC